MGCLSKLGQYPSTGPPTYQIIKVPNVNHMNVMKTSLTIFPCVLGSTLHHIRVCPGLSFATKRIGPPCCTLFTLFTCYSLLFILSQNYLSPTILVLAENLTENHLSFPSAPRWVRHSYLSKVLRQIPYTCGSSRSYLGACSEAPPERALITEGFYINTIASPMKCE